MEQPETLLRQGPLGECAALLIAVYAFCTGAGWLVSAPQSVTCWLMLPISGWIVLRNFGYCRGRFAAVLGTLAAVVFAWSAGEIVIAETIPAWLTDGPFSPAVLLAMLSVMLILELCELPWKRGWLFARTGEFVSTQLIQSRGRYLGGAFLVLLIVYVFFAPGLDFLLGEVREMLDPAAPEIVKNSYLENIRLRLLEVFVATLFFALGANFGSFLNVVVYRCPRGESVVLKPSACPKCGSAISGRDNIPVLGWIWLEGKCRSCQLPISSRYPIVEAVVGGVFLLFFYVELISGGTNLPVRTPNHYAGVLWIVLYTKWDLMGLYLFHSLLLVALLAWGLIRYDSQRVPWRALLATFTISIGALTVWPNLILVSWRSPLTGVWNPSIVDALTTSGIGGLTGFLLGLLGSWLWARQSEASGFASAREFVAGLTLVGTMLGWQAASSVLAISLLVRLFQTHFFLGRERTSPCNWPWNGSLLVAVVIQLLSWRWQSEHLAEWWPVTRVSIEAVAVWLFLSAVMFVALKRSKAESNITASVGQHLLIKQASLLSGEERASVPSVEI